MTSRDGFRGDMDAFALDAGTAERLVTGAVDDADAPPEYRAVAGTLRALRRAPERWELAGERAAVEQIASVVVLERQVRPVRRSRRSRRSSSRVARLAVAAVVACLLPLAGGLASAGALPPPAQNLASTVLDKVGISVPSGGQDPVEEVPPTGSPPAPLSTTAPSPGPGGPGPDVAKNPPRGSSPTAPGYGEGNDPGTRGPGNRPDKEPGKERSGGKKEEDGDSHGGEGNGR
jgi:hypothetical protein